MRRTLARLILAFVALAPSAAFARSEKTLAYVRDQAWPAAVRFIRVDEGLKIVEKDADAGYVLFELHEDKRTFRGSLEVITVTLDGRKEVRFVVQLEDRPSYLELGMLERLERKLRAELGSPAPAPTHRDAPPPKDGDDKDKDAPAKEPPKEKDTHEPADGLKDLPRTGLSPTP